MWCLFKYDFFVTSRTNLFAKLSNMLLTQTITPHKFVLDNIHTKCVGGVIFFVFLSIIQIPRVFQPCYLVNNFVNAQNGIHINRHRKQATTVPSRVQKRDTGIAYLSLFIFEEEKYTAEI